MIKKLKVEISKAIDGSLLDAYEDTFLVIPLVDRDWSFILLIGSKLALTTYNNMCQEIKYYYENIKIIGNLTVNNTEITEEVTKLLIERLDILTSLVSNNLLEEDSNLFIEIELINDFIHLDLDTGEMIGDGDVTIPVFKNSIIISKLLDAIRLEPFNSTLPITEIQGKEIIKEVHLFSRKVTIGSSLVVRSLNTLESPLMVGKYLVYEESKKIEVLEELDKISPLISEFLYPPTFVL